MKEIISIIYAFLLLFSSNKINYKEFFEEVKEQIEIPNEVTGDIYLPSVIYVQNQKVEVFYKTSDYHILPTGEVIRDENDAYVDIYVFLQVSEVTHYSKLKTVKVLKDENINTIKYNIIQDLDELYPNYLVEFFVEGVDRENFTWKSTNTDVLEVDEEYIGVCKKAGITTIEIYDKNNILVGIKEVEVRNEIPHLKCDDKKIIVGDSFEIYSYEYKNMSLFNIEYDSNYLRYENGLFTSLKAGKTTLTYTLISDKRATNTIEIEIFDKYPVIKTNGTTVTIGEKLKISVLNYDYQDYVISIDKEDLAYLQDDVIIFTQVGVVEVKVILKNDRNIYSSLQITCDPVVPSIALANPVIVVGQSTKAFIVNLEELISMNIEDYEVTSLCNDIAKVNQGIITAVSPGCCEIKVTNINNPNVTSVTLLEVQEKWNSSSEVSSGKLVVYLEDNKFTYMIGEKIKINVDGMLKAENFKFVTQDQSSLCPLEDGYVIPKKEGIVTLYVYLKSNLAVRGSVTLEVRGQLDVDYAQRLVEVAETQLGYREDSNGETKYGKWYGIPDGAWCAMFVTWCAHNSGIDTTVIPFYCGCSAGWQWFKDQGRAGIKGEYIPKKGDIIFFLSNGASHTGIVTDCDGNTVYTIEGNTSNMCARRSYPLTYSTITGYGIPNYGLMEE